MQPWKYQGSPCGAQGDSKPCERPLAEVVTRDDGDDTAGDRDVDEQLRGERVMDTNSQTTTPPTQSTTTDPITQQAAGAAPAAAPAG